MSKVNNKAKTALLPQLRFPEFRGAPEWKLEPLGTLAKRRTAKNTNVEHVRVLTNSAEFGVIDQRDYFEKDIANQENLAGYYIVEKGDYVYNPRISMNAPVGPISKNNVDVGVMSPLYTVFRFINPNNNFFAHYFKSTHWHRYMRQASSTGARHDRISITSHAFMGMPIPVATPKEEQKVADCLSSLDELIAAQEQMLTALKAYKRGITQQLLPCNEETQPRVRFPDFQQAGDWQKKLLSELCDIKHGYAFESEFFSNEGDYVLLTPGNFYEQGGYRDRGKQQKYYTGPVPRDYLLAKGDMLIAMTEQAAGLLGSPIIVPESNKFLHNQRLGLVVSKPGVEWASEFFFHVFNTSSVRKAIHEGASGAKVRHTSPTKMGEITVFVPPLLAEQQRIASFLSGLDAQISLGAKRIETLNTHKLALMQRLFPLVDEVTS